ncbi:MAG TPA: SDR family oxidoreductase [Polyangiaceae bacterium]|jgi:hypothetical protein|nr:SDR family oxidoreductase [Polyangiaceae bacterium]
MATALITGASAGLGAEFARCFARDRHDVVLVARRLPRLEALARKLESEHAVRVHVLSFDLGQKGAVQELTLELERLGVEVEYLVNNAGFGSRGAFQELDPERELSIIDLNVTALVALTRALLPAMVARKHGRILNIGSTAGFQPGPFMAVYYASKAFVNSFSEALSVELRGTGVTVTASCPGPTATEFGEVAGNGQSRLFKLGVASAESVARDAYRAMHSGRPLIVHGLLNRFVLQLLRVSPRRIVSLVVGLLNRDSGAA